MSILDDVWMSTCSVCLSMAVANSFFVVFFTLWKFLSHFCTGLPVDISANLIHSESQWSNINIDIFNCRIIRINWDPVVQASNIDMNSKRIIT